MENPVNNLTTNDLTLIANQAFTYGLPLVLMGLTKEQNTNYQTPSGDGAPINQFSNKTSFPTYQDTKVVRPNCDTYYSLAFLDLTDEPIVMTIPKTSNTYYMMPLLDVFTNVIPGSPGTRTHDEDGGNYIIVGPGQTVPTGYQNNNDFTIISSPSNLVWVMGRFQVNDPNTDGLEVKHLQKELSLIPLSAWGTTYTPPQGDVTFVSEGSPNDIVMDMSIADFFSRLNQLLAENPPPTADNDVMVEFGNIGVGPYATTPFSEMKFDAATITAMNNIPKNVLNALEELSNSSTDEWNGLIGETIANFGTDYRQRAMVAYVGLGANPNADAVYYKGLVDSEGNALDGNKAYCITFSPGEHPPCNSGAFWSLTLYNAAGYLTEGEPSAVGHSTNKPFYYEEGDSNGNSDNDNMDKTLKIYMQPNPPTDTNYTNNWLPTPAGETFNLMIRIYWPDENAQTLPADGGWQAPAVLLQDNPI